MISVIVLLLNEEHSLDELYREIVAALESRGEPFEVVFVDDGSSDGSPTVLDREPRGHLSHDEAVEAFEASGAKRLLVTHRPRELPTPDTYELAYDGLELDVT